MSHLKSIAFESEEVNLQKLRERLGQMSDEELIKFGKQVRALSAPRVGITPHEELRTRETTRLLCIRSRQ